MCLDLFSLSLFTLYSSFAIRGSYVKPGRLRLEINHMKWSARESDYCLLRGREQITIPPRERMDRIVAFPLSVCLLSCRLVCLFWLSSPLPINCVTFTPRPRARERGKAFVHQYFIPWWHFSTIFPNAISFPELTSGWTERVPVSRDEAVRKVSFIGWFVDGWGKIDPRQMGEDIRQTGERKDWSLGFGAKIRFFFS